MQFGFRQGNCTDTRFRRASLGGIDPTRRPAGGQDAQWLFLRLGTPHMADEKSFPKAGNPVDWNDPLLVSLLNKTDNWHLDNRATIPPQGIRIEFGWGAGTSKQAMLAWEDDDAMVLETFFPIEQGERIRIERSEGNGYVTQWGKVVESRPGHRTDDKANGIHVHWLHKG
jgi:hypothetical protein